MLNIKVGFRALLRKKLKLLQHEEEADSAQDCQSSNGTTDKGKRTLDPQGESSSCQPPPNKRHRGQGLGAKTEEDIFTDVKEIMGCVNGELRKVQETDLSVFLMSKISKLETDKRELVGVFGRTGAGKSSLINAIIGVNDLLPSGSVSACTSVMIKVEANTTNSKYEAEIEFITKEEWRDELWSMDNILKHKADQERKKEDIDDYRDSVDKLTALYRDDWKYEDSLVDLIGRKKFKEITDLLHSGTKLSCDSADELSVELVKFTRNNKLRQTKEGQRWYWPLVKRVTVRVPDNDLLQHVTLVDLPGSGDRNKSRDAMWKELVGSCSTVWIVAEITRAESESQAWEILEDACSRMGNGGECQHIHFICTKSDLNQDSGDDTTSVRDRILETNKDVKDLVKAAFIEQQNIMKHFTEECFKVFTVSSKECLKINFLQPDDTEIPELQKFLEDLNDRHSVTLNYVSGAYGILSLIQGARCRDVAGKKTEVCRELEETMRRELDKVRKPMEKAYKAFERCLTEGVEKSKRSCEEKLNSILYPEGKSGSEYHRTLRCLVEKNGIHKPKDERQININEKLSSSLTDSINEEFRKTFPNQQKHEPFKGAIKAFSLNTKSLIQSYKEVGLQLTFLQTEEEKIKTELTRTIRKRKKTIYNSLTETIEKNMQRCYDEATKFEGKGSLENMRITINSHVHDSKNIMFEEAKNKMLTGLNDMRDEVLKKLEETLMKSIELSLKTDHHSSIPDVSETELDRVKEYYNELKLRHRNKSP